MEKILTLAILSLALTADSYRSKYFSQSLDTEPSLSTLYARDKKSDKVTNECLVEMYPRNLYKYPLRIDRNDVPCIIHCVLKKFGIMSNDGHINIKNYYRRVQAIHRYDPRVLISDVGDTCAQNINGMNLDHDVCKKAKVFNDCTQLYAITFREDALPILTLLVACAHARLSVIYAHDRLSDLVAEQCFSEMYPKKKVLVQESDEPCIIFCVLRKLGIMNAVGSINLETYKKRVQLSNQLDQRNMVRDFGSSCVESAESTQHKQDVCKKAKVFNDCTHLYRILLK